MATANKQLEDMFENLNKLKPEQMEPLIQEAMKVIHSLQSKADTISTEEAIDMAMELKDSLEGKMKDMLASVGVDMEDLREYMKDLSNFSPEQQTAIKQVNQDYAQFQEEMNKHKPEEKEPKKKGKPKWISG